MAIGDKILVGSDKRRIRLTGGSIRLGPLSSRGVSLSASRSGGATESWFDANGGFQISATPGANAWLLTLSGSGQRRLPSWDSAEPGDTMTLTAERFATGVVTSGTTLRTRCKVYDDESAWARDSDNNLIAIDSIADHVDSGSTITLNTAAAAGANYPIHVSYTPEIAVTLIDYDGSRDDFADTFSWSIRFATTNPLDFV